MGDKDGGADGNIHLKMVEARTRGFRELLESERVYNRKVRILYNEVAIPLERIRGCLTRRQFEDLFGTANVIKTLSDFSGHVLRGLEFCPDFDNCEAVIHHLGQLTGILNWKQYINNYPQAVQTLERLEGRDGFLDFIYGIYSSREAQEAGVKDLALLLEAPLRRVLRYVDILGAILDATPPNHPEKDALQHAVEELDEMGALADSMFRESEEFERISTLERRFHVRPKLCRPGRRLLTEGTVSRLRGRKTREYHYILFTDAILLYKRKKSSYKQRMVGFIPIDHDFKIKDIGDTMFFNNRWKITGRNKTMELFSPTRNMKYNTIDSIHDVILDVRATRDQQMKNMQQSLVTFVEQINMLQVEESAIHERIQQGGFADAERDRLVDQAQQLRQRQERFRERMGHTKLALAKIHQHVKDTDRFETYSTVTDDSFISEALAEMDQDEEEVEPREQIDPTSLDDDDLDENELQKPQEVLDPGEWAQADDTESAQKGLRARAGVKMTHGINRGVVAQEQLFSPPLVWCHVDVGDRIRVRPDMTTDERAKYFGVISEDLHGRLGFVKDVFSMSGFDGEKTAWCKVRFDGDIATRELPVDCCRRWDRELVPGLIVESKFSQHWLQAVIVDKIEGPFDLNPMYEVRVLPGATATKVELAGLPFPVPFNRIRLLRNRRDEMFFRPRPAQEALMKLHSVVDLCRRADVKRSMGVNKAQFEQAIDASRSCVPKKVAEETFEALKIRSSGTGRTLLYYNMLGEAVVDAITDDDTHISLSNVLGDSVQRVLQAGKPFKSDDPVEVKLNGIWVRASYVRSLSRVLGTHEIFLENSRLANMYHNQYMNVPTSSLRLRHTPANDLTEEKLELTVSQLRFLTDTEGAAKSNFHLREWITK